MAIDTNGLKALSICLLGTASMLVSFGVIFLKMFSANHTVLSVGTSFSAGIFIMIGLAHMLHESHVLFEESIGHEKNGKYSPAYALCCLGYFLVIFLARGIFSKAHHHGDDVFQKKEEEYEPKIENDKKDHQEGEVENNETQADNNNNQDNKKEDPSDVVGGKINLSSIASTMIALCVHSAMEGAALGIQTTKSGTLILFVAILLHQWAEDFAAAVSSGKTGLARKTRIILALILSWSCPFGIALGWIIQNSVPGGVEAGIIAVSAGSFIAIACTDMVPEEIHGGYRKVWMQFLGLFFGMLSIFIVMINVSEDE